MRTCGFWAVPALLLFAGCGGGLKEPVTLASFTLDERDQVLSAEEHLSIDPEIKVEGAGALLIEAGRKQIVRLFEVEVPDDVPLEGTTLTWTGQLKSMSSWGWCYFEMWCEFADGDNLLRRDIQAGVARSTDWKQSSVSFDLPEGRRPTRVRLNLSLEGGGRVWVDDVHLSAAPRP